MDDGQKENETIASGETVAVIADEKTVMLLFPMRMVC